VSPTVTYVAEIGDLNFRHPVLWARVLELGHQGMFIEQPKLLEVFAILSKY